MQHLGNILQSQNMRYWSRSKGPAQCDSVFSFRRWKSYQNKLHPSHGWLILYKRTVAELSEQRMSHNLKQPIREPFGERTLTFYRVAVIFSLSNCCMGTFSSIFNSKENTSTVKSQNKTFDWTRVTSTHTRTHTYMYARTHVTTTHKQVLLNLEFEQLKSCAPLTLLFILEQRQSLKWQQRELLILIHVTTCALGSSTPLGGTPHVVKKPSNISSVLIWKSVSGITQLQEPQITFCWLQCINQDMGRVNYQGIQSSKKYTPKQWAALMATIKTNIILIWMNCLYVPHSASMLLYL